MYSDYKLILGSASPGRLKLLEESGLKPDLVIPADIDETILPKELPSDYSMRIAKEKAEKLGDLHKKAFIITADTVPSVGRRILPKAESDEMVRGHLKLISGRRHKIYTSIVVQRIDEEGVGQSLSRTVVTSLKFKRLSAQEIESYLSCKEGLGKSGGYGVQGKAAFFLEWVSGSFSNIIGLPLYDVGCLLKGVGYEKN